jgi:hypothetical protein
MDLFQNYYYFHLDPLSCLHLDLLNVLGLDNILIYNYPPLGFDYMEFCFGCSLQQHEEL